MSQILMDHIKAIKIKADDLILTTIDLHEKGELTKPQFTLFMKALTKASDCLEGCDDAIQEKTLKQLGEQFENLDFRVPTI